MTGPHTRPMSESRTTTPRRRAPRSKESGRARGGRPGSTGLTQAERTLVTQQRLLTATIACLDELGYAGTTTNEVADRAGVSRGAMVHHYPSKSDLLIAALEHLVEERALELTKELEAIRESTKAPLGMDALVDLLWRTFSGKLYWAGLELFVAARTDAELREKFGPLERRLAKRVLSLFLEETGMSSRDARAAIGLSLHLMRGMAMERIFEPDAARERVLLAAWKKAVRALVDG